MRRIVPFQMAALLGTLAEDAVRYRSILAQGVFEALGACTTALVLAAVQAVAWALVQRAALRHGVRAATAPLR